MYTTPGFVLGSRTIGEANRFLYIFTRELGLVGTSAQGVRLGTSKLKGFVQDFSYSTFVLVRGKEVWRLTSAVEMSDMVRKLKDTPDHFEIYVRVVTLLKRLLQGEEQHSDLFDLMVESCMFLISIETKEEKQLFECILVLRILHVLGYVGTHLEFEGVLGTLWTKEVLEKAQTHKKKIIVEINTALNESQL
jgi:DNA repair protein RecO (recombination protein O)